MVWGRSKPLTREMIVTAMKFSGSNRGAARYLGCSFEHYSRYAKLYIDEESGKSLYDLHCNRGGKGEHKLVYDDNKNRKGKGPALMDILNGNCTAVHIKPQKLKNMLIDMGMLECKCSRCGFKETRVVDGRSPLILNHIDGDKNNWKIGNLQFLCYNCSFIVGGADCPITDSFVEKAEDAVERRSFEKPNIENFELESYQKEFLKNLGLKKKDIKPGSQYISRV